MSLPQEKLCFIGRSYKDYSPIAFTNELLNQDWNNFNTCVHPEEAWDMFTSMITRLLDVHCPLKQFNIGHAKAKWMDAGLLMLIKDKNNAVEKYKKTLNEDDYNIAIYLRNYTKNQFHNYNRFLD